jgi:hypothetical protein
MKGFKNTQFTRSSLWIFRQQRPHSVSTGKVGVQKLAYFSEGEAERPVGVNASHPVGYWVDP